MFALRSDARVHLLTDPIVAASRSKRLMIRRRGRILRRKPDSRPARFAVLHITGTAEDPAVGAHAAFLDELAPHAVEVSAAATWLS